MPRKYWLFKSEPETFSIDHLAAAPNRTTAWEGVRNYQARNFLRDDVAVGDEVLFYHSSVQPSGVVGRCRVTKRGYPDRTALDPGSPYFDPKATEVDPRWYLVDLQLVERFPRLIPLAELKTTPGLENMMVVRRGMRLSIQPVTAEEWQIVLTLARQRIK
jgi:predicted RNA-binding protein with PUA-like domain